MTRTRRHCPPRTSETDLPQDEHAERAAIGAVLYGGDDDRLDVHLFGHECRRAIITAAITLRGAGDWPSAKSTHPRDELAAAHARGDVIIQAITQAGTWAGAADVVEYEVRQSLDAATGPYHLDVSLARLLDVWRRREWIIRARRIEAAAHDGSADVSAIAAAQDLTALADGSGPRRCPAELVRFADVEAELIRWLWPGRIARGKLTLIAGQPGLGKSLLSVDVAARVSRGWAFPDGTQPDGAAGVILMSAEDDPADTIRPRLDAAGADVQRIDLLRAARRRDPGTGEVRERSVSLTDLATIRDALRQRPQCRLMIVDPVSAYLAGCDTHRNSNVRGLLAPLCELAAEHDVALLAVTHLCKSADGGRSAVERVNGSLAFAAAARAVYVVGRDPDRPERRIISPAKNNLGPDATGLAYSVEAAHGNASVPVLSWEANPVTMSADELLSPLDRDADARGSALTDAIAWLRDQLAAGDVPAKDLQAAARRDGMSWGGAVRRAKDALGVQAHKGGHQGAWSWSLPADPEQDAQPPTS